jgi:hypothetical protein
MSIHASCIAVNPDELLDAAAQSLINRRCRDAALHEVRGGLQALYSSLELLSRAAKSAAGDAALAERAIGIARRAMANFEPSMLHTIEALTTHREAEARVNVGEITREVLRFLRTDIANKLLVVDTAIAGDAELCGRRDTVRLWILGIIVKSIDASTPGGPLAVEIARVASGIDLKVRTRPAVALRGDDVVLAAARAWAEAAGGRFELSTLPGADAAEQEIRIFHP